MLASDLTAWPHIFRPGDGPVILALHGTGGNEEDILRLADRVAPGAAVLAPRGRVSENGASRWFRRMGEGVFDVDDVILRAGELAEFVTWSIDAYRLQGRPMIAVGFSNGANMALALATLHPASAPAVVAFSGMYPFGERDLPSDPEGSRLLLLNGADDPMAPSASVDALEANLTAAGAQVLRVTRPGGHGISESELDRAAEWILEMSPA